MNIVLIGASGFIGSALLAEASRRGHTVTALVKNPARVVPRDGVTAVAVDVNDGAALTTALRGHDAVLSAFSGHAETDVLGAYRRGFRSILGALKASGVPRLLLVGGAASLQVAPGVELLDTPAFPAQWKATALGARDALMALRDDAQLDWTVLSPSAHIEPGRRTGTFRLGTEQLLVDATGESRISLEDYAVAMIDELEKPGHTRQRFTVGY